MVCFRCVAALRVSGCEVQSVGVGEGSLEMEGDASELPVVGYSCSNFFLSPNPITLLERAILASRTDWGGV